MLVRFLILFMYSNVVLKKRNHLHNFKGLLFVRKYKYATRTAGI